MIPQHFTKDIGGTVSLELSTRPTTVTLDILTDTNAEVTVSQSAAISSVNTTLSSAASARDTTVSVASATGFAEGVELRLDNPPEKCRVKSVSGTTITLWEPLLYAHASGEEAEGTQVSFTINSAVATSSPLFWDGRVIWTVDSVKHITAVECTKYPLRLAATEQDVYAEDPEIRMFLSGSDDLRNGLQAAFDDILTDLSGKGRNHVYTASHEFNRAVVFKYLANLYRRGGESSEDRREIYEQAYQHEFGTIASTLPRDDDQDAYVEAGEKISANTIRITRG